MGSTSHEQEIQEPEIRDEIGEGLY
jgi:hypothetical protein